MHRKIMAAALAAVFALAAPGASAQTFPSRPVTLIVPWPAGGTTDLVMRALATATEKHLGQSITIENRPGAAGTLGPIQMAATASPDGYTVAQIPITVFRAPFMSRTTFDPTRDLTYVIGLTGYTFGVVVREDSPWKTFRDFLADAKRNPGKINYGTPGAGTSLHITMEQIAKQQGIQWTHIPFKGNADTTNALLGGHIHAVADFDRLGAAGRCRKIPPAGDLGGEPYAQLAERADAAGDRHRHGVELALRHRGSQRHRPEDREDPARRVQEGPGRSRAMWPPWSSSTRSRSISAARTTARLRSCRSPSRSG